MQRPSKSFSYVIQVALTVVKTGPDAAGVAWVRREFKAWFDQSLKLGCLKKVN